MGTLPSSFADSKNGFSLNRSTFDGGGELRAIGGEFELSATIGQPDAGMMASGEFELNGGFWFELVAGDCAEDGGVSTGDISGFVACLSGPLAAPATQCACADFDGDGDTDLFDVSEFQRVFADP